VWISPIDAESLGVKNGDHVILSNELGALVVEAIVALDSWNLKNASTKLTHTWQGLRWTWGLQDEIVIYEESDVIE
jgi:anaerobic selenocysteine-containing dehydrogenase